MTAATGRHRAILVTLQGLVPVFQLDMGGWTAEKRRAAVDRVDRDAVAMSDTLLFGRGNGWLSTAADHAASATSLNAIALGLAVMSYQPGGVTFAGLHWCVNRHCGCPTWPRAVCAVRCEGCPLWRPPKGGGA